MTNVGNASVCKYDHPYATEQTDACRFWRQYLCSVVCGVWGLASSRGQAVKTVTGNLTCIQCHIPSHLEHKPACCIFLPSTLNACTNVFCVQMHTSAPCTEHNCRFNDFLCHTSGMGTVDHEKVLVGNLPSKSLYEYCFHPDQLCWKVSICLLHNSHSLDHLLLPCNSNCNHGCGGLSDHACTAQPQMCMRSLHVLGIAHVCHVLLCLLCLCCCAVLEQPGQGLHPSSRWHVLQNPGAHRGRGAFNMAGQHHCWGGQALPFCGRVWNSKDGYHSALPWHLDCQQQHCAEHELL